MKSLIRLPLFSATCRQHPETQFFPSGQVAI